MVLWSSSGGGSGMYRKTWTQPEGIVPRRLSAVRKVHLGALSLDKVLMVILLRSTLVVLFPRGGGAVRRCLCEKNGGM